MKHTKRLLAIVLAMLVLGSVVAVPTAANEVVPGTPVITHQPNGATLGVLFDGGLTHTMRVTAQIPGGGTMRYIWQRWHEGTFVNANVHSSFSDMIVSVSESWEEYRRFRVIVYNAEDSALPLEQRRHVISEEAIVTRASGIPEIIGQTGNITVAPREWASIQVTISLPGFHGNSLRMQWEELLADGQAQIVSNSNPFTFLVDEDMTQRTFRAVVYRDQDRNLPLEQRRHVISEEITVTRDPNWVAPRPTLRERITNSSWWPAFTRVLGIFALVIIGGILIIGALFFGWTADRRITITI